MSGSMVDESYQCLNGALKISSKNKNQNLVDIKNNRKEASKIKEFLNPSSPAKVPSKKEENNKFTNNDEFDGQQKDYSNNGVNREQNTQVVGIEERHSPDTVQQSSMCPCCIIM
ncbi:unnamed protein product [Chironomus riparius]|uniref:Uncharacterized protein n=1 Tax=Chironomus riparius TaxID=315576 RepID=A0A9N9WTH2_9DIPT|nr:unnamed protein product [Chironomus riparius]